MVRQRDQTISGSTGKHRTAQGMAGQDGAGPGKHHAVNARLPGDRRGLEPSEAQMAEIEAKENHEIAWA